MWFTSSDFGIFIVPVLQGVVKISFLFRKCNFEQIVNQRFGRSTKNNSSFCNLIDKKLYIGRIYINIVLKIISSLADSLHMQMDVFSSRFKALYEDISYKCRIFAYIVTKMPPENGQQKIPPEKAGSILP